jgi:hypothetical protein
MGFDIDIQATEQIIEDWNKDFIQNVYVIDKNKNCEDSHTDAHDLFEIPWEGLGSLFYYEKRLGSDTDL